ncbi:ABC transporter ATP-binding protein [Tistrella bauzanensis]|uniref:ABC transporter ATP-binding protein n=1 Tax=Tistrella arctica TaxID=3133430 RepID=A0ABU9YIW1_9PROT
MPRLTLDGIAKSFGGVPALADVTLDIAPGTVHAVLGENGAGKSTLMNILSGLYRPDAGTVRLDGRVVPPGDPKLALDHGFGMIHQHLTLVDRFTGAENIALATGGGVGTGVIAAAAAGRALARDLGFTVDLDRRIEEMPPGMRQRVEILKVLVRGATIVVLDEPTSVLTPAEASSLMAALRRLAAAGRTVLLVTHKLAEVFAAADAVTVLRRGRLVATLPIAAIDADGLAALMVGPGEAAMPAPAAGAEVMPAPAAGHDNAVPVLEVAALDVDDDAGRPAVRGVSFRIHEGEVLGIAGVDGNGQAELAEALAGLRRPRSGDVLVDGVTVEPSRPRQRLARHRVAYVPRDRHHAGLVLDMDGSRNLILRDVDRPPVRRRFGIIDRALAAARLARAVADFDVRGAVNGPVRALSGGNQQKLVLARELGHQPRLLIAEQPTKGLDVAATAFVQRKVLALTSTGAAVLYISTELDELRMVADRIAVMSGGRITGILSRDQADPQSLGRLMGGIDRPSTDDTAGAAA